MDNGIKLFGADGFKLSDALELEIELAMDMDQNEILGGARSGRPRMAHG